MHVVHTQAGCQLELPACLACTCICGNSCGNFVLDILRIGVGGVFAGVVGRGDRGRGRQGVRLGCVRFDGLLDGGILLRF